MKIKKSPLIAAMLLATNLAFAARTEPFPPPPPPEEVRIDAALSVMHCFSDGSIGVCDGSGQALVGNTLITLYPVETFGSNSTRLRGIWSTVVAAGPFRYVGIVTVYKETWQLPSPRPPVSLYKITVEIINESGVLGKMSLETADITKLAPATLHGREDKVFKETYEPRFYVGPAQPPCAIGDHCDSSWQSGGMLGLSSWQAILGRVE